VDSIQPGIVLQWQTTQNNGQYFEVTEAIKHPAIADGVLRLNLIWSVGLRTQNSSTCTTGVLARSLGKFSRNSSVLTPLTRVFTPSLPEMRIP